VKRAIPCELKFADAPLPELVSQNESTQTVDCTPDANAPANRPARSAAGLHVLRAGTRNGTKRKQAWLGLVLLLAGVVATLFVFRARLLTGLAEAWMVNDPLVHADAIVVLGGGFENRPAAAARLYQAGFASNVLYMNLPGAPRAKWGNFTSEQELTRQALLANGVPESAMVVIGEKIGSTHDEALAVQSWVRQTGAKGVIIPTDMFHTRRARWLFRKELTPEGVAVAVRAVPPVEGFGVSNWWRFKTGRGSFENEMIKLPCYWCLY